MNFFGHAIAATWVSASPRFWFAAMLPDLASMLGERPPTANDQVASLGIAYHHATDRVFHQGAHFVALQAKSRHALASLGLPKGARLAVAHIGPELMLDAELAREGAHMAAYVEALNVGRRVDGLLWKREHEQASSATFLEPRTIQLRRLCERLLAQHQRLVPANADELVDRLQRILQGRAALRLAPEHQPALTRWAAETMNEVKSMAGPWLHELRSHLVASDFQKRAQTPR